MPRKDTLRTAALPTGTLYALPTDANEVVSWYASFRTNPDFSKGSDLLQRVTVSLLDKGTRQRDRFEVADLLENMGAQLAFYSDELRVGCFGRSLRADLPAVIGLMAEQWLTPSLDEEQFDNVRTRIAANITRNLENTGYQAGVSFSSRIYPTDHPNYLPNPRAELALLEEMTIEDVRAYHRNHFSGDGLLVALAGDFDLDQATGELHNHLSEWPGTQQAAQIAAPLPASPISRSDVPMDDKMNLDVRLGHSIDLKRSDTDYVNIHLASRILGGNSSSRLMSVIRDEKGMTYGIYSSLSGFTAEYGGHWVVKVTLSQEMLEAGIEATEEEVRRFVAEGVTDEELADKKTTIEGAFKVQLATTRGVAGTLLRGLEYGFGPEYMYNYPKQVAQAELAQVNAAIKKYLNPDSLQISVAGTLPQPV